MREKDYNDLSPEIREKFVHSECRESNEWANHKDDEIYVKLKKAEREAKKKVQEYLFNKRHKL